MSNEHAGMLHLLQEVIQQNEKMSCFHRFIGIESDEEIYFENIHHFFDSLNEKKIAHHFVQEGLSTPITQHHTNLMNRYWTTVTKLKEPVSRTIVDVTFGHQKEPLINGQIDDKITAALAKTLDLFRENQRNLDVVKNFYFSLTFWVELYMPSIFSKDVAKLEPTVYIYWGEIKRNEAYFLFFLSLLNIQVVYVNPLSEDGTGKVNRIKDVSATYEWANKKALKEIPKRVHRTKTIAAIAQKEIQDVLHSDSNGIYKPWQFEHHEIKTVPLQTTLEELFILWREPAKFRTGFEVKNKVVHIPNIFAKVSGVPEDIDRYLADYGVLTEAEQVMLFNELPLVSSVHYHKQNIVLKNGFFEQNDIKKMREYDFHHLRQSIQEGILQAINELIGDQQLFINVENERDFPYIVLHTVLRMNGQIVNLLQTFDYADQIPKVVVFDGKKTTWTIQDVILLGFLHKIGFDVIVLTPTGYQNMERYMNQRFFDHHKHEKFVFDLNMEQLNKQQKKSWFDWLFK